MLPYKVDKEEILSLSTLWRTDRHASLMSISDLELRTEVVKIKDVRFSRTTIHVPFTLGRFEPLYRPFKYIYSEFMDRRAQTRFVISMIGSRYESILKMLGKGVGRPIERLPLGSAYSAMRDVWASMGFEPLDRGIVAVTMNDWDSIQPVNLAKHDFEVGRIEPLFSIEEMLAQYFRSREIVQDCIERMGLAATVEEAYKEAVAKTSEHKDYLTILSDGAKTTLFG